ncbi:hypothetical protein Syun_029684 [Stephania yunnanensis]|uniref:RRM domain-containing protein n=1 Tax=Stephania yunnanensis TaxID=152371 RepID=A0AAP0E8F4_9MAGN
MAPSPLSHTPLPNKTPEIPKSFSRKNPKYLNLSLRLFQNHSIVSSLRLVVLAGLSAVSGPSVSSRWSPSLRLVVQPGLSAFSGLAVSLVSPSRRTGLRHRPSTLALSANTHDQELFSFRRDHSPCDGFEELLNCYNVFAQLLRLSGWHSSPLVEIKRTIPKGSVQSKDFKTKKIFVGGVPTTVSEDEFKNFFSKNGKVVEHHIIRDHNTNRSRGTPGLGGRLGGYGGYSGGSELGGGYGGFGGSGLGAYRGNAIRFESILCKTSVDSTAYIASLITILTELSEALMSSPDENGDFVKLESILSLKGKNAAMVLCWLLGNGCLFAWNGMLTSQDYYVTLFPLCSLHSQRMYELLCVLLYAYVFGKLLIVKYYRAKAA